MNTKDITDIKIRHIYYMRFIKYYMSLKTSSRITLRNHIICWTLFIFYEIFVTAYLTGRFSHPVYYVLFYSLNICLFYFHACFILPKAIKDPLTTLWRLPLFISAECGIYLILVLLISFLLEAGHFRKSGMLEYNYRFFTLGFWRWVTFFLYSTGYYYLLVYLNKRQLDMNREIENQELKLNLVQAEKDFLRTQINPHLLFNTLNFVKFAAKNRPKEANEAIIRLSAIMRYALEQSNTEFVFLRNELEQVKNIIELNQLRFGHKLLIEYHEEVANDQIEIIPVVLLTIIENMFKHGTLTISRDMGEIKVITDTKNFILITKNKINRGSPFLSSGNGLKNIDLRLKLCYHDNYKFEYGVKGDFYFVKLQIPIVCTQSSV